MRVLQKRWSRGFIHDVGRPVEVGVQPQTSHRGQWGRSRVVVVSVGGKGGAGLRRVRIKKPNASEPLMTCRKNERDFETGIETLSRAAGRGGPVYDSTGVRHEGGVTLIQAWVRTRKRAAPASARVPMRGTGTESLIVGRKVL